MSILQKLVGDRVLVRPFAVEDEVTKGGIVISNNVKKELPKEGIVVALPDADSLMGRPDPNSFLSVGDRVIFNEHQCEDVTLHNDEGKEEKYKLMFLDCIYCTVTPQTNEEETVIA